MDSPLESAFLVAATQTRMLQLKIGKLKDWQSSLTDFCKVLNSVSEDTRTYLLDVHGSELARIKYALVQHKEPVFVSLHDKIFTKLLNMKKRVPQHMTTLFESFIKGITYFAWQQYPKDEIPIYHRLNSCGRGADDHRDRNHICLPKMTRPEKSRRRALIERCYLERLIFDEIYRKESIHEEQDKGHQYRLSITKEDFQSCCNGWDLNVEVGYTDNHPVRLVVKRFYKGNLKSTETYEKTYSFAPNGNKVYDQLVTCTRETAGTILYNVQSFQQMGAWKKRKE